MKKIFAALFLLPLLLQAAVSSFQATYIPASEYNPESYMVNVNHTDGTSTNITIQGSDITNSKVAVVMNESSFSLPRTSFRFIMYLKADGTQNYIDCHMKNPFATQQVYSWSSTATNDISTLQTYIEAH